MSMRAIKVGGIPSFGRIQARFTSRQTHELILHSATSKALTSQIGGGLAGAGKKVFMNPDRSGQVTVADMDSATIDLSLLTQENDMSRKEQSPDNNEQIFFLFQAFYMFHSPA